MESKGLIIVAIIGGSLFPVYLLYKYIQKKLKPGESGKRFFLWLFFSFLLVFGYTFLLVFAIKLLFPGA